MPDLLPGCQQRSANHASHFGFQIPEWNLRHRVPESGVLVYFDTGLQPMPRSTVPHPAPVLCILFFLSSLASAAPQAHLRGTLIDENGAPVASAQITASSPSGQQLTVFSDSTGQFELNGLPVGEYRLTVNKPGYFRLLNQAVDLKEGMNEISFTIHHESEIQERVEVNSASNPIEPEEPAHQEILVAREIRVIPVPNSHDLQSSLPILPGVVRDNHGQIHIAGGRTGETQVFLDGFDIGDPVAGGLTSRVNVDTVREIEVNAGRYGVQYGQGGAGVLVLDTTVGDDKFRAGMTNFVPGVDVQQGVHLGNWYPRFTLSGPIEKGRAWFSEALSLQHTYTLVTELPKGENTSTQWAGDNLLRAQINLTPSNLLQGSFLYNRRDNSHMGLGPVAPLSTTTSLTAQRSFVSLRDQAWTKRVLFDVGVAADIGSHDSRPMGSEPFIVQPSATSGNYFEAIQQRARRWQLIASMTTASRRWHGTHNLQSGIHLDHTAWTQTASRTSIEFKRQNATLAQETSFAGSADFGLSDLHTGVYVQDSWTVSRPIVLQAGVRWDWDRFLHHSLVSPRLSISLVPWSDDRSKFSIAWGTYYQPLVLDTVGPSFDQQRLDTFYDSTGSVIARGPVTSRFILPAGGLMLPRFYTTNVEWEQKIRRNTYAGINLLLRSERGGLAYGVQPSQETEELFLLQDNRRDRYRAVQFSLRHSFSDKIEASINYTRSNARSNEVLDYSLETLVFAPQQGGPLEWDAPNRILSSGWAPLPLWDLFFSYWLEYRTGYPFSVVNEQQQLVGAANRLRFPDYMSLNLGIEKRFKLFSHVWAVRMAVINASNHANPDSVINNIDSPDYLQFAGGQKRAFTARVRLVG